MKSGQLEDISVYMAAIQHFCEYCDIDQGSRKPAYVNEEVLVVMSPIPDSSDLEAGDIKRFDGGFPSSLLKPGLRGMPRRREVIPGVSGSSTSGLLISS